MQPLLHDNMVDDCVGLRPTWRAKVLTKMQTQVHPNRLQHSPAFPIRTQQEAFLSRPPSVKCLRCSRILRQCLSVNEVRRGCLSTVPMHTSTRPNAIFALSVASTSPSSASSATADRA